MIVIKKKSLVFASIYILGGHHKLYLIFDEPNVLSYLPKVVLTLPNINIFNLDQEHWKIFGSVKNLLKKKLNADREDIVLTIKTWTIR